MPFTSNGYTTTPAAAWADAHPTIGLAKYGVRSPADWKVTPVPGQDRTVSITAGRGFGHGVTDKTVTIETVQHDAITSPRWDMIACRRDWNTGTSQFVKVNGNGTPVIPGGRNATPGNIDDQPLALVRVTGGEIQPSDIIDLRTWSGDGGGLVGADDLVRSFLNAAGTRINIKGVDWIRRVGANDTNEWVKVGEAGKVTLYGVGGALQGTPPANGSDFLEQEGTLVATTDPSGFWRLTFPKPFPNGLLSVQGSSGDGWANGAGVTFESAGGFEVLVDGVMTNVFGPAGYGTKSEWVYQMVSPSGARIPNKTHRMNWRARGW